MSNETAAVAPGASPVPAAPVPAAPAPAPAPSVTLSQADFAQLLKAAGALAKTDVESAPSAAVKFVEGLPAKVVAFVKSAPWAHIGSYGIGLTALGMHFPTFMTALSGLL